MTAFFRPRVLLVGMTLLVALPSAHGAGVTDLASAFDVDDPYDFHFRVQYGRTLRRAALRREQSGVAPDRIELVNDLRFSQVTHLLTLRAEAALWRDLQFHLELPVVVGDTRTLSFSQNGGDPCGTPPETNCVTPRNSPLVRDGLVDGRRLAPDQVALAGPDVLPGQTQLPTRAGIDQLYLGLSWAPLNQRRDPAKPTWVVGFEARLAVGPHMEYDPRNPTANTAVGQGVHQLRWHTVVSRRFRYLDPWFSLEYLLPVARPSSLFSATHFPGSGQERERPQHRGGAEVGLEIIPWEVKDKQHKLSIELRGRIDAIFEGRGYSPLWELFSRNPRLTGPCDLNPAASNPSTIHPWNNGSYCPTESDTIPHPGITRIENYMSFGGTLAATIQLSKYFRGRLGASLAHELDHFVTFADAGRSSAPDGRVDPINPSQVNPMYRAMIDAPGRRYRVGDTTVFDFFLSAMALF